MDIPAWNVKIKNRVYPVFWVSLRGKFYEDPANVVDEV